MQRIFEALSSEVRRKVLLILADGDLTAGEIADRFALSKSTLSQHLSTLQVAGLVTTERRGQFIHYSLARAPLREALTALLAGLGPDPEPEPDPAEGRDRGVTPVPNPVSTTGYWRRMD